MAITASHHAAAPKKATNVSLAEDLLAEKRAERWLQESHKAFDCWNDYVEKNGLPLDQYRSF